MKYSLLADAKKEGGSAIMIGILEGNEELISIIGEAKCESFLKKVKKHEEEVNEIMENKGTSYLSTEELRELIELSCPVPIFSF